MAKKSTFIHVAVDKEMKSVLTREAKQKKVSVSWVIREAVEAYLNRQTQQGQAV